MGADSRWRCTAIPNFETGRRDGLIRSSRFDTGASFITCTHGSSSYWNPAHSKHKACEAQLHIRCVSIRIPPVGHRHLVEDQKDAKPTTEDKPAHDAPCADGCRAHDHRLGESRQMMTRKVLRCVTPTPSGICDERFDSLSHGGALEHARDRHAESHACEIVQRSP